MTLELNCCWIAVLLAITNLISLFVFFNYSIKINGKDKAIQINKNSLPVNWEKLQTNYQHSSETKIEELEQALKNIQELLTKKEETEQSISSNKNEALKQQVNNIKNNIPPAPPMPKQDIHPSERNQDLKTQLHEELKKRRKKIDDEE